MIFYFLNSNISLKMSPIKIICVLWFFKYCVSLKLKGFNFILNLALFLTWFFSNPSLKSCFNTNSYLLLLLVLPLLGVRKALFIWHFSQSLGADMGIVTAALMVMSFSLNAGTRILPCLCMTILIECLSWLLSVTKWQSLITSTIQYVSQKYPCHGTGFIRSASFWCECRLQRSQNAHVLLWSPSKFYHRTEFTKKKRNLKKSISHREFNKGEQLPYRKHMAGVASAKRLSARTGLCFQILIPLGFLTFNLRKLLSKFEIKEHIVAVQFICLNFILISMEGDKGMAQLLVFA